MRTDNWSCHDKMGQIKTNKTLHLTELLAHLKSFNNYVHSTEDKQSNFFIFQKQLILRPKLNIV